MKLYTKTGDKGETGLFGGERVKKNDLRIEALGSVDEINAAIGVAACYCSEFTKHILEEIQNDLFTLGAELNSLTSKEVNHELPKITEMHLNRIEASIDFVSESLPEQKSFLLPGGTKASAFIDNARAITRRTDRIFSSLLEKLNPEAVKYVNRLADLLFALSRKEREMVEEKSPKY